jgi:hypothetical protein
MGLSTDADKSLTEIVNDLHDEIDALREQVKLLRNSRDKWKEMAEFFANRMIKKLGD